MILWGTVLLVRLGRNRIFEVLSLCESAHQRSCCRLPSATCIGSVNLGISTDEGSTVCLMTCVSGIGSGAEPSTGSFGASITVSSETDSSGISTKANGILSSSSSLIAPMIRAMAKIPTIKNMKFLHLLNVLSSLVALFYFLVISVPPKVLQLDAIVIKPFRPSICQASENEACCLTGRIDENVTFQPIPITFTFTVFI